MSLSIHSSCCLSPGRMAAGICTALPHPSAHSGILVYWAWYCSHQMLMKEYRKSTSHTKQSCTDSECFCVIASLLYCTDWMYLLSDHLLFILFWLTLTYTSKCYTFTIISFNPPQHGGRWVVESPREDYQCQEMVVPRTGQAALSLWICHYQTWVYYYVDNTLFRKQSLVLNSQIKRNKQCASSMYK